MQIRLNKYLSDSGICSRREADEHISNGEVKINGLVAKLGDRVDEKTDEITFKGVAVKPTQRLVYYALYKPVDVISTSSDEKDRKNVTDLVPKYPRVYPVGRLDMDSEGLIILTNDGDLTYELTHPKKEHEKEYQVSVRIKHQESWAKNPKEFPNHIRKGLENGFVIDGKLMKADTAKLSLIHNSKFMIQLTIHTGYNRQIRKMCAKLDLEVLRLKRIRIGKLHLDRTLKLGQYVEVRKEDII